MSNLVANAFNSCTEWLGETLPNQLGQALPFLRPTEVIPFEDESQQESYTVSSEQQERISQIFQENSRDPIEAERYYSGAVGTTGFSHKNFPDKIFKQRVRTERLWARDLTSVFGPIHWEARKSSPQTRVLMSRRLRDAIKKYDLDKLHVPKKKLAKARDSTDVAVVDKLDLMDSQENRTYLKSLDKSEVQTIFKQLFTLIIQTGCTDMKFGDNIAFIKSGENKGKLAIYDTESFGLENIHEGRISYHCSDPSYPEYQRERATPNTIYRIGGPRNAEILLGLAVIDQLTREIDVNSSIKRTPFDEVQFNANCEYLSNLAKAWTLRLLCPCTVAVSLIAAQCLI